MVCRDSNKLYRHTFRFENDPPDAELITSDPVSEINLPSEGLPCNENNHHRRLINADQIDLDRDGILDLAVTYSCVDQDMRNESEGTPREQGNHFLYKASINYICLFLDNGQDFYEQKECLPFETIKESTEYAQRRINVSQVFINTDGVPMISTLRHRGNEYQLKFQSFDRNSSLQDDWLIKGAHAYAYNFFK